MVRIHLLLKSDKTGLLYIMNTVQNHQVVNVNGRFYHFEKHLQHPVLMFVDKQTYEQGKTSIIASKLVSETHMDLTTNKEVTVYYMRKG